jgi:alkylhydroperoxidase family enzyme
MSEVQISTELKHLVARTSAIAKGHQALAASAAVSAHHVAEDKDRAIERIKHCYGAATDQSDSDLFNPAEKLALRLAWLFAQTPIVTPSQFVKPLTDHFSTHQVIELVVACGIACTAQRMAAAMQAPLSADEETFCRENGIETDVLLLKYPLIRS